MTRKWSVTTLIYTALAVGYAYCPASMWKQVGSNHRALSSSFSPLRMSDNNGVEDGDDETQIQTRKLENEAVDYVLSEMQKLLGGAVQKSDNEDITFGDVTAKFDAIFNRIKDDDSISYKTKQMMTVELNIALDNVANSEDGISLTAPANSAFDVPPTSLYYSSKSPYCVVYGPGPVGRALREKLTSLGSATEVRYIDSASVQTMSDIEMKVAVRGVKTLIIAADNEVSTKQSGWFDREEPFLTINEKNFKRLLDAVKLERNVQKDPQPFRVVSIVRSAKESKSAASFLTSPDNAELDSDIVVLQCRQRGFGYAVIKAGKVINDDMPVPTSSSSRPLAKKLKQPEGSIERYFYAITLWCLLYNPMVS
jgi:hypothetical protein